MSMMRSFVRAFTAFSMAGIALSCDHEAEVLGIPDPSDDMFRTYVAIGNSITAGMQAGGISDATQQQSYAVLVGRQMSTRFAYPSLAGVGCPAPVTDWRAQTRPTGPACSLRNVAPGVPTDILNNTGVPGSGSTEVNAETSPWHNTLTTLFLGGKTQVGRAIDANPTFVTVWIGNNDALDAATVGRIGGDASLGARPLTSQTTFTAAYDDMIADLQAGAPNLEGGMLIGVVRVANAPRFFPVTAFNDATFRTEFGNRAGGAITVHPSCSAPPGSLALVSFEILKAMQAGLHPRLIACDPTGLPAPVGDLFIIDTNEQTTLNNAVNAYNTYIQTKANSIGFGYYDPNTTLAAAKVAGGCIALIPNPAAAGNTSPFGTCVSNDGVHPAAAGQRLLANDLITAINNEYLTTIPLVP
jgi:lysophospholipase L1-like esterase